MKLDAIAAQIGAEIAAYGGAHSEAGPDHVRSVEIKRIYASNQMSGLLGEVRDTTLLATELSPVALVRLIELMDVPAICLLNGAQPGPALLAAASAHQTAILSPKGDGGNDVRAFA